MSVAEQKSTLRGDMFARRGMAHEDRPDTGANARLAARIGNVAAGTVVSAYWRIGTEIDPFPTMAGLCFSGARVCLPMIEGKGRPLKFREWTPRTLMTRGPFRVDVPEDGDWLEPTILIVPLLAWDRAGGRLGYGGGYYDRTLAGLRAAGPVTAIGFAYKVQEVDDVPREPTDLPLDAIVTEDEVVEVSH